MPGDFLCSMVLGDALIQREVVHDGLRRNDPLGPIIPATSETCTFQATLLYGGSGNRFEMGAGDASTRRTQQPNAGTPPCRRGITVADITLRLR
jgi:hypothetical protein